MKNNENIRLWFIAVTLSILSVVLILAQFIFSGDIRYDKQTVEDLQTIETKLQESDGKISSLEDLQLSAGIERRAQERNYSLKFIKKNEDNDMYLYEICADFKTNTEDEGFTARYQDYSVHASGTECFEREIYLFNEFEPTNQ